MAFCSQCGAKNEDGAKFCGGCGAPLTPAAGQAAPTAEQPKTETVWKTAPTGQPEEQAAPTAESAWAQPPWADPTWQAAPTAEPPKAQPTGQATPGAQAPQQNAPSGQPTWQATSGAPMAGQGRPNMTQVKEPRGWIGIIGAVVALISMFFFPMLSIPEYGLNATFFDVVFGEYSSLLSSETGVLCLAALASIIVGAILYLISKNQIGRVFSIIGTAAYFFGAFGTNPGNWGEYMDFIGMGFWVALIGCIVMILSMTLKNANASIDAAFGGGKK